MKRSFLSRLWPLMGLVAVVSVALIWVDIPPEAKLITAGVGVAWAALVAFTNSLAESYRAGRVAPDALLRKSVDELPALDTIDRSRAFIAIDGRQAVYLISVDQSGGEVRLTPARAGKRTRIKELVIFDDWAAFRAAVRNRQFRIVPQSQVADRAARRAGFRRVRS